MMILMSPTTLSLELLTNDWKQRKCYDPADPGPCKQRLLRWYYNVKKQKCDGLIYGGCGGNENNYPTYVSCAQNCV